jgi:uncharacterized damage-inducible protein DinB
MRHHDPVTIALDHNHWANTQVAAACARLNTEGFHRRFEMGLGSLHDTLLHILSAMRGWTDLLAGREQPRWRIEGGPFELAWLERELDAAHAELVAQAHAAALDATISRERQGKVFTHTRAEVIVHVTTHGVHHRA